jgi:hypothetical protein
MRTTVTLDADTDTYVRTLMRERGLTFKQAVNEAIRAGAAPRRRGGRFTRAVALGPARVELTKALQLAGQLEDEALLRELHEGR